jgi:biopolymer transport protein ExbD
VTLEEVVGQFVRLARAGGVGLPIILVILAVLAVALVVGRHVKLPPLPPPSPDPEEHKSPPIEVRPDGSIPVANPTTPPDYLP